MGHDGSRLPSRGATLLLGLVLSAAPARGGCPLHGRSLHELSRPGAVTTLHPPGAVAGFLPRLARRLAEAGCPAIPTGAPESRVPPRLSPAERLEAVLTMLVLLESRGVHRRPDGSLLRSRHGEHVGFTQIGEAAARSALEGWRARRLDPPAPGPGGSPQASLRESWTWNLRLGALYFLELLEALPGADGDPVVRREERLLRAFAAYVAGPEAGFVRAPAPAFREGVARRPEVKRYVRHAAFGLGLLLDPASEREWRPFLTGRSTHEAGGWEREREGVRQDLDHLLRRCPEFTP